MRKVLIVDDNVAFGENIAEIVSDAGVAEAVVADSGMRALELLKSDRFDVMVTDMRMPRMDGAQLISHARQVDPSLPVVVLTAFTADDDLSRARNHGILSVLPKPAPVPRLLELIAQARRGSVVAVVEDDVPLAENIAEALRDRGFATVVAHSVSEAERLGGAPCVALVDLRVPGGADGAALTLLKARFPDLPIVVVTAYRDEIEIPATVPVIEKPFVMTNLLAIIEELVPRHQSG